MTLSAPILPNRSECLPLSLPLSTEQFHSLTKEQQNNLIAEQVLGWIPFTLEIECSQYMPGAQWVHGGEYYALTSEVMVPPEVADQEEEDVLEWLEAYGSRDWMHNIGAAMQLFEAVELLKPYVYKLEPTELVPWVWCCCINRPLTGKAFCFNGCVEFKDLPGAIALTGLEAIGVITVQSNEEAV